MPLQNRADPTGRLFANSSRGLFTGNRGVIHDADTRRLTGRGWTTKAWIICDCGFQGRKREVFGRNARIGRQSTGGAGWTNLFFLDEVTALAAGHRPCFECRREKAKEFADCFGKAFGVAKPKVAEMDTRLHAERWLSGRPRDGVDMDLTSDGVMFAAGDRFFTRRDGNWLEWGFEMYRAAVFSPDKAALITAPTIVAILAAGYQPIWHPSAAILA